MIKANTWFAAVNSQRMIKLH